MIVVSHTTSFHCVLYPWSQSQLLLAVGCWLLAVLVVVVVVVVDMIVVSLTTSTTSQPSPPLPRDGLAHAP